MTGTRSAGGLRHKKNEGESGQEAGQAALDVFSIRRDRVELEIFPVKRRGSRGVPRPLMGLRRVVGQARERQRAERDLQLRRGVGILAAVEGRRAGGVGASRQLV